MQAPISASPSHKEVSVAHEASEEAGLAAQAELQATPPSIGA